MSRIITKKNRSSYQDIRAYKRRKEQERKAVIDGCEGREGYVYIFKLYEEFYKIGMTTNLKKRIKDLKSSCPKLICIWTARVRDRYFAETDLKKTFKKKKFDREVYKLNMPEDMKRADQVINKYR